MKFSERLHELRTSHELTQSELSKILHYGYSAISNYESGRNEPNIKDLKLLANYFDVSLDYLLGSSDIKRPLEQKKIRIKKRGIKLSLQLIHSAELMSDQKLITLSSFLSWLIQYNPKQEV